jgi:site-specific DNA-methyltransferase (cytosine-N4-specific)
MAKDGVKVQMCVTSPPYFGLRDYGVNGQIGLEQTPQHFIDNLVEVFACVWDILADDGTLWVNLGDSYANNSSQASNNGRAGFGNPREKVVNRIGNGYKQKDLMGMPWRLAFALQDFGWYLRQDIIWHKPNPMPESVTDRCTKSHEYIFLLTKNQRYYFDNESIREPIKDTTDGQASVRRSGDSKTRSKEHWGVPHNPENVIVKYDEIKGANKRSVWSIPTKPYLGAHFAVYPEELIEPCILAGSKAGDIVLDPFFGSGTTGAVAQNLGRRWIGCELNKDYEKLQNERLAQQGIQFI